MFSNSLAGCEAEQPPRHAAACHAGCFLLRLVCRVSIPGPRERGPGFKTRGEGSRWSLAVLAVSGGFSGLPLCIVRGAKPKIELLTKMRILTASKAINMITYRYQSWEENEREHAEERRVTAELIASGQKTAREIQDENSLFPIDSVIEMKWAEYAERYERMHA